MPTNNPTTYTVGPATLTVVAEGSAGVELLTAAELAVLRTLSASGPWPHRQLTLFVLDDMGPLARQLAARGPLPPAELAALLQRPAVNVYDLANLAACSVFVNRPALLRDSILDDALALEGLLAHEHAHPLAENPTVRASRQLAMSVAPAAPLAERQVGIIKVLRALAETLVCSAPRELFANQLAIERGAGAALLHLNQRNLAQARRSLEGRTALQGALWQQVARGELAQPTADLLLLVADLQGFVALAVEVAPFIRAQAQPAAATLNAQLADELWPRLGPAVAEVYTALCASYTALPAGLPPAGLAAWGQLSLAPLGAALASHGLPVAFQIDSATTPAS